jgi:hypothetical protein
VHRAIISEIYGSSRERDCLYGFDTNEFGKTTIEIIAWSVQTAIGPRPAVIVARIKSSPIAECATAAGGSAFTAMCAASTERPSPIAIRAMLIRNRLGLCCRLGVAS